MKNVKIVIKIGTVVAATISAPATWPAVGVVLAGAAVAGTLGYGGYMAYKHTRKSTLDNTKSLAIR